MVKISDLNKRERSVRKSLADLEKRLKDKKISQADYNKVKKDKENELKSIELERENIIAKLPPMPPPPKPSRMAPRKTAPEKPTEKVSAAPSRFETELKKHEKDLLFTQSEMSKLFAEVVKNRERIKKVEEMVKQVSSAQSQASKVDTTAIEQKLTGQVDRMDLNLRNNFSKTKEDIDRVSGDVRALRRDLEEIKKSTQVFKTMDVSGIRRDIESLKSKSEWLEKQMENLDIEPLYELIKELEGRVSSSGGVAAGPVIIE